MGEAKPEETEAEEPKPEEKEEKPEEKKEEKDDEKKKEANPSSPPLPPPVILLVDLHCVGCAKKIERCIMKCRGVEKVMIDMVQNQVTVKGIVDPQALCSRLQKKTMRNAKVISPPPPEDGDSTKSEVVASQVSEITTVELLVNMHCEACAQQLKRKILKMRGVQMAETELKASKVTVTGTMSGEKLVEYIHRRTGKLAKIIPPPPPPPPKEEEKKEEEKPPEEKKEEKPAEEKKEEHAEEKEEEKAAEKPPENADGEGKEEKEEEKKEAEPRGVGVAAMMSEEDMVKRMMYWTPVYVIERLPPPQMFSDENPNACCIS